MGEWPQVNWAAVAATWPGEGDDIPVAPRRNTLGTTALTPPILGDGGTVMTNTVEAEAPEPVDIHRMLDDTQAFRAAEAAARRRYVESTAELVAGLMKRGQNDQAMAILRSLTQPGPFWATRYVPGDGSRS